VDQNISDTNNNFITDIYAEIVDGFSEVLFKNNIIYIKHLTLCEGFKLLSSYNKYINIGQKKGLFKEQEKVADAIKNNWWSSDYEQKISFLKLTIKNLYKTKQKILYESQKELIADQIKKNEFILTSLLKDRSSIVGYTCENYADKKYERLVLESSIFRDKNFSIPYLTDQEEDDYDYDEDNDDRDLMNIYNEIINKFEIKNLKLLAASGFLQNLVFSCDESYSFWGKPVNDCSRYQNDLFLLAKMYRNIIKSNAEIGKPIHEDILSSPERLIAFIEKKQLNTSGSSSSTKKSSDKNSVSSYVGATNQDLKELGVKVEKFGGKSLLQLAREKGGIIEKSDYLSVREKA
jgi:hypothetical protein